MPAIQLITRPPSSRGGFTLEESWRALACLAFSFFSLSFSHLGFFSSFLTMGSGTPSLARRAAMSVASTCGGAAAGRSLAAASAGSCAPVVASLSSSARARRVRMSDRILTACSRVVGGWVNDLSSYASLIESSWMARTLIIWTSDAGSGRTAMSRRARL